MARAVVDLGPIVRQQVEALGIPVVGELLAERARQDEKWGQQDHPDLGHDIDLVNDWDGGPDVEAAAEYYGLPFPDEIKRLVDQAADDGTSSWVGIATEELVEAMEAAAQGNPDAVRTEVIQLAAVCVAWVQAIDRRRAGGEAR